MYKYGREVVMKRMILNFIFLLSGGVTGIVFFAILWMIIMKYDNIPLGLIIILNMPKFIIFGLPIFIVIAILNSWLYQLNYHRRLFTMAFLWFPSIYFINAVTSYLPEMFSGILMVILSPLIAFSVVRLLIVVFPSAHKA